MAQQETLRLGHVIGRQPAMASILSRILEFDSSALQRCTVITTKRPADCTTGQGVRVVAVSAITLGILREHRAAGYERTVGGRGGNIVRPNTSLFGCCEKVADWRQAHPSQPVYPGGTH